METGITTRSAAKQQELEQQLASTLSLMEEQKANRSEANTAIAGGVKATLGAAD
jgi:hypothetical protein